MDVNIDKPDVISNTVKYVAPANEDFTELDYTAAVDTSDLQAAPNELMPVIDFMHQGYEDGLDMIIQEDSTSPDMNELLTNDSPQDILGAELDQSPITGDQLFILGDVNDPSLQNGANEALNATASELLDGETIDDLVNAIPVDTADNNAEETSPLFNITGTTDITQSIASTSNFDAVDDLQMLQLAVMAVVN